MENPDKNKSKKRKKIIFWAVGILILFLLAWLSASGVSYLLGLFNKNIASGSPFLSFLPKIKSAGNKLKGEEEGRVNILLLGMPGPGHPGPELTDTIIILSIKPAENKAAMLSIPRDLYVKPIGTTSYVRINSVYTLGEEKAGRQDKKGVFLSDQPIDGYHYLESNISEITSLPIHYYLKMDFSGFEQIIDQLGGVDVYVEKDLYDPYYPTNRYGYQTFRISQGQHHMDGELALKFARSRETTSDFDRAKRQQIILSAIKEKMLKLSIFDTAKIVNIIKIIGEHFKTDLTIEEIARLAEIGKNINQDQVINRVLDNSAKSVLRAANYNGAAVLIPKTGLGDYEDIQRIAKNIFEEGFIESEAADIEVQNGTFRSGLASSLAKQLTAGRLNVIKVTSAKSKFETSQIIDYSSGTKSHTIEYLKSKTGAKVTSQTPPAGTRADILVILGANYKET